MAKRDALVANYGEQRDALLADLLPEASAPNPARLCFSCALPWWQRRAVAAPDLVPGRSLFEAPPHWCGCIMRSRV